LQALFYFIYLVTVYNMSSMRFKYDTGIVTLVQFIVLSLLSLANSLNSIISTCVKSSGQCIENMIPSILLFILIAVWFAFIWVLGYTVQERRSRKLAVVLMGAEFFVAIVALFSVKHHSDWLSLTTSAIDLFLAVIVIILAFRVARSGGSRVVAHSRGAQRRRRRHPPTTDL
jgi:hypothetical protein